MMSELFTVEIFGDKLFEEKITAMAGRVSNARPAMRLVAGYLMGEAEKRFDEQGPGWEELSKEWEFRKLAHGWDSRILHKKGRLRSSVTKPRSRNQILRVGPSSLVFGSALPYAQAMQKGYAPGNIPARPFLVVTPENRIVITNIIREWIMTPTTATKIPAFGGGFMRRGHSGWFTGVER
jgi:phage gpG-like protein